MTTVTLPPPADVELAANAPRALTVLEQRMLAFERRHFANPGRREQAIRDEFGHSATRYYQVLNWLIDRPEAAAYRPELVNRLRRQRAARQAARSNPTARRSA